MQAFVTNRTNLPFNTGGMNKGGSVYHATELAKLFGRFYTHPDLKTAGEQDTYGELLATTSLRSQGQRAETMSVRNTAPAISWTAQRFIEVTEK